jgi:hypothetical protein
LAKQGRRQRYHAARSMKTASVVQELVPAEIEEPCPECRAVPGSPHAAWCEFEDDKFEVSHEH